MKLIIGLGNPGSKYDGTRHNAGSLVIDALLEQFKVLLKEGKGPYRFKQVLFQGETILLVKPALFMNESGKAVRALLDQFKVDLNSCLVLSDDVNLPLGTIRLRLEGSAGGHNGLESVIQALGTEAFPRLRIGVGASGVRDSKLTEYVLGRFSAKEAETLAIQIDRARKACLEWAAGDSADVMARYN